MRLVPILTALVVGLMLYGFLMERDLLRGLAGAQGAPTAEAAAASAPAPAEIPVVARHSAASAIDSGVTLRGRTEARRRVDVRAEVTGRVVSEPIRRGAEVEEGDLLCRLDPGDRPGLLAEAEARLLEAEANERASAQLAERGFTAETTAIARRAALLSAQAAVEQARREIERLEIAAPFSGLLETDTAELGELMQPGSVCAAIIDIDPIKLVGYVAESNVERVRVGAPVAARLVTGQTLEGIVTFVARAADPESRTFRVEAQAPNPDFAIRDGISAEILVALPNADAHLVPLSALTLDDDGRLGIRAVEDGRARFHPVTVVRDDRRGAWVSGLPPALDIIVVGQDFVIDGQPVAASFEEGAAP